MSSEKIKMLAPSSFNFADFEREMGDKLSEPFNDVVVNFINSFSRMLLTDVKIKPYPDLVSLGFWMRKSHIRKIQSDFESKACDGIKVPRGVVFHIAPSNVDTIFVYSLFLSLMLGNKNIVRISQNYSERQKILLSIFNELLGNEFLELKKQIAILTYSHDREITDKLSSLSDVRMIWGGDNTISEISRSLSKPTCIDLKFANKYSYAIIDAGSLSEATGTELEKLASDFVNDAFLFGQQACSSPRTVFWLNHEKNKYSIDLFWRAVEKSLLIFEHGIEAGDIINKYVTIQEAAIDSKISYSKASSNLVSRVTLDLNKHSLNVKHCGSGLFFEIAIKDIKDALSTFGRSDQTLSYFGIDKKLLSKLVLSEIPGIDRIVPIGKALEFSSVWDGYDLPQILTRNIDVR
ncbi:acyl-CoA reductase [Aliikangiella sp. IMCC44653]